MDTRDFWVVRARGTAVGVDSSFTTSHTGSLPRGERGGFISINGCKHIHNQYCWDAFQDVPVEGCPVVRSLVDARAGQGRRQVVAKQMALHKLIQIYKSKRGINQVIVGLKSTASR
jgi:hypothetical protein